MTFYWIPRYDPVTVVHLNRGVLCIGISQTLASAFVDMPDADILETFNTVEFNGKVLVIFTAVGLSRIFIIVVQWEKFLRKTFSSWNLVSMLALGLDFETWSRCWNFDVRFVRFLLCKSLTIHGDVFRQWRSFAFDSRTLNLLFARTLMSKDVYVENYSWFVYHRKHFV